MKNKLRFFGISLLGSALMACLAASGLAPAATPTVPALLSTPTAFSPQAAMLPPTPTKALLPTLALPTSAVPLPTAAGASGPAVVLSQVHPLDQVNGWGWSSQAADGTSRLLRTQAGGATWRDVSPQGQGLTPFSSSFLDLQTAWVALYDPNASADTLLRTTDGGQTWVSLPQAEIQGASYEFTSPTEGVAVMAGVGAGNLYLNLNRTQDGAASWTPLLISTPRAEPDLPEGTVHLCSICGDSLYYDPARLVITYGDLASDPGGAVRLSVSTDLGRNWKELSLPLPGLQYADGLVAPQSPVFFGNEGFLPVNISKYAADGTLAYSALATYLTQDGGQTWSQSAAILENKSAFFDSVQVLSPREAFVRCGSNLCVTHDGAQTWQTLPASLDFDINSAGSFVSQFQFIDLQTGWAVVPAPDGSTYRLWKSTDGGATWAQLTPALVK